MPESLHRYRMQGNLDDNSYLEALERLERVIAGLSIIGLSAKVKKRASEAFPVVVKTHDALHISSALLFKELRPAENLLLFSYDTDMNRCAKALGVSVPLSIE